MKKIFLALALAAMFYACNKSGESETEEQGDVSEQMQEESIAAATDTVKIDSGAWPLIYAKWVEIVDTLYLANTLDGEAAQVNGKNLGMFMGGTNAAILYQGGLMDATAAVLSVDRESVWGVFEKTAGTPVMRLGEDEGKQRYFGYANPDFIDWAEQNMIPAPTQEIAGLKAQVLYDKVLKRFFRTFYVARKYLEEEEDMSKEMKAYQKAMPEDGFNGPKYLSQRYHRSLFTYNTTRYDGLSMWHAVGFWLRRGIDGTDPKLWTILKKVMADYDGKWLKTVSVKEADQNIEKPLLSDIYGCWWESPYEYMFDGAEESATMGKTQINGRYYGQYMAGINGIMDYGSLNSCAARLFKSDYLSNLNEFDQKSLYAMYPGPGPAFAYNPETKFRYFDNDFLKWFSTEMVPDPQQRIAGIKAQDFYDKMFKRFFRMMADTYIYITKSKKYADEQNAYEQAIKTPGFEGKDWLKTRYADALPQYNKESGYFEQTPQLAIGFWLRRGIDGSSKTAWTEMEKWMRKYDPEFF